MPSLTGDLKQFVDGWLSNPSAQDDFYRLLKRVENATDRQRTEVLVLIAQERAALKPILKVGHD